MTPEEAIDIIANESECVKRANKCNRDCGNCELVRPEGDIIMAYSMAITALEALNTVVETLEVMDTIADELEKKLT